MDTNLLLEENLKELIRLFYEDKQQLDEYKKSTDEYNKNIKDLMGKLDTTEFESDDLIAKISVQNRESFNEPKLIEKLKELNIEGVIKTKEYVDMDVLENVIYDGFLNASELTPCKEVKTVTTLKVLKKKVK